MSRFDDRVRAALDSLPPDLAAKLENLAVVVEDENAADPDLFGLFESEPPAQRVTGSCRLAHFFGLDEDRLGELGYA